MPKIRIMTKNKEVTVKMSNLSPLICEMLESGGCAEITVTGNSMRPMLRHRVSRVRLAAPGELRTGDVPLYKRSNGSFVLHRIIRINGDEFTMCGDNEGFPEPGILRDSIVAVMTHFSREGKKWTPCTSTLYRIYIRLWMLSRPVRYLPQIAAAKLKRIVRK